MLILGLTSSTASVGVALSDGRGRVVEEQSATDRRHAEELTPMLVSVLAQAGATMDDVDCIAADIGPGRFTGLRVGVATARALALACDLPVIGISSLELLSAALPHRPVIAVIDARRNEVFQQGFDAAGATGPPRVGPPDELAKGLPEDSIVVGDGADRYAEAYGDRVVEGIDPTAAVLVDLARDRAQISGPELQPLYLRDPDVQVNIKTRDS